jgi:hypothetical protein
MYVLEQKQEDHKFEASLGKDSETLSQRQNTNKRDGGVAQVVECLPSMCPEKNADLESRSKIGFSRSGKGDKLPR